MTVYRLGVSTLEADTLEGAPPVVTGAADLSGSGTLTSAGLLSIIAASSLSGSGTLTSAAVLSVIAASSFSGLGTLTSAGLVSTFGSTALDGSGTLTGAGLLSVLASATLAGNSFLSDAGIVSVFGGSSFSGIGSALADAVVIAAPDVTVGAGGRDWRKWVSGLPPHQPKPLKKKRRKNKLTVVVPDAELGVLVSEYDFEEELLILDLI